MDDAEDLLTSGEVALTLGVGPSTVKRWTTDGELVCVKTLGGHRRFARREVMAFAQRNGLDAAKSAGNVMSLPKRSLVRDGGQAPYGDSAGDHVARWLTLLAGEGRAYEVQGALLSERAGRGSWWKVAEAMGEVLAASGRLWVEGRISIVQEHLATERLQRGLSMVSESLPVRHDAPRCLLATSVSEDHTLGLSLLELCMREAGWLPRWVGRNTPTEELVRFVGTRGVEMVALSASAISQDRQALEREAQTVATACEAHDVALLLGGSGFWPDNPRYGHRVRTFSELRDVLEGSG